MPRRIRLDYPHPFLAKNPKPIKKDDPTSDCDTKTKDPTKKTE